MEWIAIIVLAIVVIVKSSKIKKLEERLSETRDHVSSLRVKLERVRLSVDEQKIAAIKPETPKPPPVVTPTVTAEAFKEVPKPQPVVPIANFEEIIPPKPTVQPPPVMAKEKPPIVPVKSKPFAYNQYDSAEEEPPRDIFDSIKQYFSREKDKEGGLETFLGKRVLNKLGVIILVFGIVFLVGYYVHHHKWSKIIAGTVSGIGLIGLGVYLERKELFKKFAQPLIGGGWAVLYFTTYASYHIEAVKVLNNHKVAIGLLMAVATGMIAHSLKYKSQALTFFAYLLAFGAIWISNDTFSTLLYALPLSTSLMFLQIKFGWDILSFIGQIISYLLYGVWAFKYATEIGSTGAPGPHFTISLALLTGLWLVYQIPFYFVREASRQLLLRYISQAVNTILFAIAFGAQLNAVYPENVYLFLIIYSAVQAGHAVFQRKRDKGLSYQFYVVPSALGLAIGLAYKYSHYNLSWSWLIEAEALLLLGIVLRESIFRHLALMAFLACLVNLGITEKNAPETITFLYKAGVSAALPLLLVQATVAFINSNLYKWMKSRKYENLEAIYFPFYAIASAVLLATAIACRLVTYKLSWGWLAEAELLLMVGIFLRENIYRHLSFGVFLACLSVLGITELSHHQKMAFLGREVTAGLPLLGALTIVGYCNCLIYRWLRDAKSGIANEGGYIPFYMWVGSVFLGLSIWNGLEITAISAAWGLCGVILLELGLAIPYKHLRIQANIFAILSFAYLFFVDFGQSKLLGVDLQGLILLIVGTYNWYFYWRPEGDSAIKTVGQEISTYNLYAWLGLFAFAWLVKVECPPSVKPFGWSLMAISLLYLVSKTSKRALFLQATAMCIAAVVECVFLGLADTRTQVGPIEERWLSLGSVSAVLLAMSFMTQKMKLPFKADSDSNVEKLLARSHFLYAFMASGLLAFLCWAELEKYYLTVAWAIEGFALVMIGILARQKVLRYPGLTLLVICIGKIALVDLSKLETPYRILSFIGLGILLIAASYLYIRFQEKLERVVSKEENLQ